MPSGDRKIARYLRELTLARALKRAQLEHETAAQSAVRGLTGGELARATRLIQDGQAPEVKLRVTFVKMNAGKIQ